MWNFIKALWRALVVTKDLVFGVIAVLLLLGVVAALMPRTPAPLPDKAALVIRIDGILVDQRSPTDPLVMLGGADGLPTEVLLRDVLTAIDRASTDPRIAAVSLELDGFFGAGPGTLETVGRALDRFRESGKPIYGYGRYFAEPQYQLAARASELWLHPMGGVVLTGYGQYNLYFKDALERLKVNVHVFKAGRFKSFVEPYDRQDMSPEAREAARALYAALWGNYVAETGAARTGKGFDLTRMINDAPAMLAAKGGDLAQMALAARAVDRVGAYADYARALAKVAGDGEDSDGLPSFSQVDMERYLAATSDMERSSGDAVGVLYVSGDIIDGEGPAGVAGGDTIARLVRQAMQEGDIKALVVRINSPGGSATAAEAIREQLALARAEGLPIVASFGTVAASGGYWVATAADEIWAEPSTITGSIGVFGIIPTFEETLASVGVTTDGVGATPLADAGNITRPLSPAVATMIQATVDHTYQRFIGLVAANRKMTLPAVDTIGQGRVWAGSTARELKLVDHIGGLEQAIAAAARRAGLKQYRVIHADPGEPWKDMLLRKLLNTAAPAPSVTPAGIGVTDQLHRAGVLLTPRRITRLGDVQATCLECLPFSPSPRAAARTASADETLLGAALLTGLAGKIAQ